MKREEWETNRDIARRPKASLFWCFGCDAQLVEQGKQCKNCGKRNGRRTNRKKEDLSSRS